jgi:hypothetical protein
MSDEPVLPRSPIAKHAATDGENLTDIGLHYHLSCHGGVICTGARLSNRPQTKSIKWYCGGRRLRHWRALWQPLLRNYYFAAAATMAHLKMMARRRFGSSQSTPVNRNAPTKMSAVLMRVPAFNQIPICSSSPPLKRAISN